MEPHLDLTLLPVSFSRAEVQRNLSGIYVSNLPRHPARGRSADKLILFYRPADEAMDDAARFKLMEDLSEVYYQTSGPVTGAMRVVAERLNQYLLERRVYHHSGAAADSTGALKGDFGSLFSVIVLRQVEGSAPILYMGQCGLLHIILGTQNGVKSYSDLQRAGRGLGLGKVTQIHYMQFEMKNNDFILFTRNPSLVGDLASLQTAYGQSLDRLHRTLLNHMQVKQGTESDGMILLHSTVGTGRIQIMNPRLDTQAVRLKTEEPTIRQIRPEIQKEINQENKGILPEIPVQTPVLKSSFPTDAEKKRIENPPERRDVRKPPEKKITKEPRLLAFIITFINWLKEVRKSLADRLAPVFTRWGAEKKEEPGVQIPQSVMAFIAIAVPVIVVAVTSMLYLQRGLTSLNKTYYQQAQRIAVRAVGESKPAALRKIWHDTLDQLDKAEKYQSTNETKSLRTFAEASLDDLDGITRLDFQPVLSGRLASTIEIRRIIIVGEDLYLYNATNGDVLRAQRANQGYEIDPDFNCRPGPNIAPLLDIAPGSPSTDAKGTVLGIDANGKLIYCKPKSEPTFEELPVPDGGWSTIKSIILDGGMLYVLDPGANKIWTYVQDDQGLFSKPPAFFFSEKIPSLKDSLAMVNHRGDFYILYKDGHMITCVYDIWYGTPTRCEDPAQFTDAQTDKPVGSFLMREKNPVVFDQIMYAPPPDPSIYLLEPDTFSVFHLSLRLTLQGQFRPKIGQNDLRRAATAFTVGQNRMLFLAVGNNVLGATIP
jgi:hypothetical protein